MQSPTELNIVLLGRKGDGKSSSINTIMREKSPQISTSSTSSAAHCHVTTKNLRGKIVRIVETPGLFDTSITETEIQKQIVKCITHCVPGVHAFIIILKVGKYTAQEEKILENIQEQFGEDVLKYATILFTNGDQLDDDQTIEDFVWHSKKLQELVDKCGGRVHVIDNKYWNQQQEGYRSNRVQVEKLLNTIEEMVRENGGQYYSNEMLAAVRKYKGSGKLIELFDNMKQMVKKKMRRQHWTVVMVAVVLVVGVYKLYY